MPRQENEATPVDKDMARVNRMADRLKLRGKQRAEYIHEHMQGLGYRTKTTYVHPDDDDSEDNSGGRFGFGRRNSNDNDDDDF